MSFQSLAAAAGFVFTAINLANLFLSNKTRADIAELKVSIAEQRSKDREELKEWAGENFQRADVAEERFKTLKAHIAALR